MNDLLALDISSAGMNVQRERLRVVAENLANAQTTGADGPYQRKEVIVRAVPASEFEQALNLEIGRAGASDAATPSVAVATVQPDGQDPVKTYDPTHPLADAQGYVAMPNISVFREMTDMIEASRMYDANMAASKATRDMLSSALELIRK